MESIKDALQKQGNMSEEEADHQIALAKETLHYYLQFGDIEAAENICMEYFGLEPDYLQELM